MKLLIAYDGSKSAEAAIDDLVRAGLPEKCDCVVISVAEVWLPPVDSETSNDIDLDPRTGARIDRHISENKRVVAESQILANHAKNRIRRMFPQWSVTSRATYGSPAFEVLFLSEDIGADLIVVGSHGRSGISCLFLGSVSQKVVTEAKCSVRVGRGRIDLDRGLERVVIGFDGTDGAKVAAAIVSKRKWGLDAEIKLVAATESSIPSAIGRFMPPNKTVLGEVTESERKWVENQALESLQVLSAAGFKATLHISGGNPRQLLIEEAERWGADSIFVGANSARAGFESFLIGSTSAAVAARANCSVEVVRGS